MQPHQLHSQGTGAFIEWVERSAVALQIILQIAGTLFEMTQKMNLGRSSPLFVENFLNEAPKALPFVPL